MTLYNQMVAEIGQQRGTEGCNVEQDVTSFVDDPNELDIWSNDYFLQLADMMVFKQ